MVRKDDREEDDLAGIIGHGKEAAKRKKRIL